MTTAHTLTKQQRRELEAELRSERARLERTLMTANDGADLDSEIPVAGSSVYAPGSLEGSLGLALESRTHARYQMIVDALARLEADAYGICVGCTKPIPYGRLLVMPEATHCVACGLQG